MNKKLIKQHEVSRKILKEEIMILKRKRKDLKKDIEFIESSFNGGLAIEVMETEATVKKVVRVLNERLHHSNMMFMGDDTLFYNDVAEYNDGNIIYDGRIISFNEDSIESFEALYNSCVHKIIDNETDEVIKLYYSTLRFHCDEIKTPSENKLI